MLKRFVLFSLSLLISVLIMAGCAKNADEEDETTNTQQQENEKPVDNNESEEPVEIVVMLPDAANAPIRPDAITFQKMDEILGINLVVKPIPSADYEQKKKTLMATDDLPDIIKANRTDLNTFASAGIFLPLLDRIKEQAPNFKLYMEEVTEIANIYIGGELYAFPTLKRFDFRRGIAPVMRTDLLDELNLEMPESFDELHEVLKEMKNAYPDSAPMVSRNGSVNILKCMAYPMGSGYGVYWDKDVGGGRYVYGTVTPEMKNVIAYLRRLYEEGILDPDYISAGTKELQGLMTSGKSFFFYDNPSYGQRYQGPLREEVPTAVIETIPLMTNQLGNARDDFYSKHVWGNLWAVSAKTKNPDEVIRLMDFCYSDEGVDLRNFGVEGVHYDIVDGKLEYKPELMEKFKDSDEPVYTMQTEIGVGQYLNFTPCIDMQPFRLLWAEELLDQYQKMEQNPAWHDPKMDPPFSEEELDSLTDYMVQTETIMTEVIDKIIMGLEPLDAFDSAAERAAEGAGIIEDIYNSANERLENSLK